MYEGLAPASLVEELLVEELLVPSLRRRKVWLLSDRRGAAMAYQEIWSPGLRLEGG